jgi:hypothetical protein
MASLAHFLEIIFPLPPPPMGPSSAPLLSINMSRALAVLYLAASHVVPSRFFKDDSAMFSAAAPVMA